MSHSFLCWNCDCPEGKKHSAGVHKIDFYTRKTWTLNSPPLSVRAFDRSRPHLFELCYPRIYCACTHETSMIQSWAFLYYNAAAAGRSIGACLSGRLAVRSSLCCLEVQLPPGDIPSSVEVVVFSNLFVHVPEAGKTVRKGDKIARRNADFLSCTLLVY